MTTSSNLIWPYAPKSRPRTRSNHTDFVDARSLDLGAELRYEWDTRLYKHRVLAVKDDQTYRVEHLILTHNGGFVSSEQITALTALDAISIFYSRRAS